MAAGGMLGLLRSGGVGSVVAGVAAGGALVLGLSPVSPTPARAAEAAAQFPVQSLGSLPALPSVAPLPQFAGGGGGVVGEPWTLVGLPGALGADDLGLTVDEAPVLTVPGQVVRVTSVPGRAPYRFVVTDPGKDLGDPTAVVWDSGVVSGSSDTCVVDASQAACTIPASGAGFTNGYAGLTPGGTYRLVVTDAAGTDGEQTYAPRMFSLSISPEINGTVGLAVNSPVFRSGDGGFGLGLSYSTGSIGPVPGTAPTAGLTPGLPPGWAITGVPGGHTRVSLVDAQGFQGQSKLLRITSDSGVYYLGCVEAGSGLTCTALDGLGASLSPTATVAGDGSVQLTDGSSSTVTSFDAKGRMTGLTRPFEPAVDVVYDKADRIDSVSWNYVTYDLFYAGESQCSEASIPPGFVKTPAGSLCGWRATTVDGYSPGWLRLLYTQPEGAQAARVSRTMGLPADCSADFGSCAIDETDVNDIGWDDHNRPLVFRDAAGGIAALSGAIEPGDVSHATGYTYDELGRMATVTKPAVSSGTRARQTVTFGPADARFTPATRQVATVIDDTDGLGPAVQGIAAFDERARVIYTVSNMGEVSGASYEPDVKGKAVAMFSGGLLTADGIDWSQGTGAVYGEDSFGRTVTTSQAKAVNFDPATCLPNGAARAYGACKPVNPDGKSVVTGSTEYDSSAGVPQGLIARWFESPDFTGNVVATTVVDQSDGSAGPAGFDMTPPTQVAGEGSWSTRISGSVLMDQAAVYGIEVEVPQGFIDEGVLILDGSTICTPIVSTRQTCTYDNTEANPNASTTDPHMLRLDLTHTKSQPTKAGQVVIRLSAGAGAPVVDGTPFRQRFGAVTTKTGSDITPDGMVQWSTRHAYDDPVSRAPSTNALLGQNAAAPIESKFTTDVGRLGAPRPTSLVMPSGASRTTEYWGEEETPASAGLPFLEELPADLQRLPQRSAPKSAIDAGGGSATTVYDHSGRATCTAREDGHWACSQYDQLGRLAGSVTHGDGNEPDLVAQFGYDFDASRPDLPMVQTVTYSELQPGGALGDEKTGVKTTVTRSSLTGDVTEFTDSSGMVTTTTYDVHARPVSQSIRMAADEQPVRVRTVTYRADGQFESLAVNGKVMVTVRYDAERPWNVNGYDYAFGNGVKADRVEDDDITKSTVRWTFADGSTLDDVVTNTVAGRMLAQNFGSVAYAYSYDDYGRLAKATVNGSDYTYGWDSDGLRTCAAEGIPNPGNSPCESLPGAFTYTYDNQRMVSTTDPVSSPGGQAGTPFTYDDAGNLTQVGDVTFTYDASGRVVALTSPQSTTVYERDAFGRISRETTTGSSTESIAYLYSSAEGGPAAMVKDGTTVFFDGLPGGARIVGNAVAIPTAQGHTGLWLTADGVPDATRPSQAYTPYGVGNESAGRIDGAPAPGWKGTATTATGNFINLGPRTYLPRLAAFAQPDPIAGGSGAGPYSYVAGDPINFHDLSGYASQGAVWASFGIGLLGFLIVGGGAYFVSEGIFALVSRQASEFWTTGYGPKIAHIAAQAIGLGGATLATSAQQAIINNGHSFFGASDFLGYLLGVVNIAAATISSYTTYATYKAKQVIGDGVRAVRSNVVDPVVAQANDLFNKANTAVDEAFYSGQETIKAALNEAGELGNGLVEMGISAANDAIGIGATYASEAITVAKKGKDAVVSLTAAVRTELAPVVREELSKGVDLLKGYGTAVADVAGAGGAYFATSTTALAFGAGAASGGLGLLAAGGYYFRRQIGETITKGLDLVLDPIVGF